MLLPVHAAPMLLHAVAPQLYHHTHFRVSALTFMAHLETAPENVPLDTAQHNAPLDTSREILNVALPILGACLAEPLLSMIDTACVGRLTGAGASVGLAALNVNAGIFNMISCCISFLCTASTAVIGGSASDSNEAASRSFRDGLIISVSLGTCLMVATLVNRHTILSRGFGLSRLSPAYDPAISYLKVRALSLPAVCATLVGAGVSLGLQDTRTPLFGVLLAFAVNVVGDLLCVWRFSLGITGAAVATACASYASALLVCGGLVRRLKPCWRRPLAPRDLLPFVACSGALLTGTALNAVTYTWTSRVAAASGLVAEAAAHQIGLQGWWLLSFVSVPLSLAGQSLLPRRVKQQPRLAAMTIRTLIIFGFSCAFLMAAGNALLTTHLAILFSADPTVLSGLNSITFAAVASQACISLATALDGIFIGCGWLCHYCVACMFGTLAALAYMGRSLAHGGGLLAAWHGLLVFSALRVAAHVVRLPILFVGILQSYKDE